MGAVEVEAVDAVVVGSGFGGSVAAHRLAAEGGRSVVVLERGRPHPPGSFPRTPREVSRAFWDPAAGLHGMFEVFAFRHVNALVSSGLGGGSLIYANVLLPKPAETYDGWPLDHDDLAPHLDAVRDVLRPVPFPDTGEPYASTPKTAAFTAAATRAGLAVERAPLAVAFAPPGGPPSPGLPLEEDNLHGHARRTCRLCGACDLGCNEGAKHTLDLTYLSRARDAGAEIRTCCEVVAITPGDGGYRVRYRQHLDARAGQRAELLDPTTEPERTLRAKVVVVAAGTFGSTRLLLANRAALPRLGPALGRRFSSNGDLLSFARGLRRPEGDPRYVDFSDGPVITVSARDARRATWIQEGGAPAFGEWLWQGPQAPRDLWRFGRALARRALSRRRDTRTSALIASALGDARSSAAMLPLLSMGLDAPEGRMRLRGDVLELDWSPQGGSAPYFAGMEEATAEVARALGGHLMPRWLVRRSEALTVHPLGGCPMGADARRGVVDAWGEAFGHPGLFVTDGSVLPGPVGPNPSLTIAAVAHRSAERVLARLEGG